MTKSVQMALDQLLRVSGLRRRRVDAGATTGRRLHVVRRSRAHGLELIGELSCEGDAFVFRYEPSYDGPPTSAFPDKDSPYKSDVLWPFFEVRVPPTSRKDVQDVMSRVNADDPLEVLAVLGGVSVTNPYELRLAGEGAGGL